jgi:hypothetical protein
MIDMSGTPMSMARGAVKATPSEKSENFPETQERTAAGVEPSPCWKVLKTVALVVVPAWTMESQFTWWYHRPVGTVLRG